MAEEGSRTTERQAALKTHAFTTLNGFLVFWEFLLRENQIQSAPYLTLGWL